MLQALLKSFLLRYPAPSRERCGGVVMCNVEEAKEAWRCQGRQKHKKSNHCYTKLPTSVLHCPMRFQDGETDAELPALGDKHVIGYVHSLTWRTLKTPGTTKQHNKQATPTINSHSMALPAVGCSGRYSRGGAGLLVDSPCFKPGFGGLGGVGAGQSHLVLQAMQRKYA